MMIYCKLAWRNVLRNKRRTLIAGIAIGIGLAALIYVDALILGMEDNMVKSATSSFLGEGQIHREGFRQTFGVDLTVNNLAEVVESIKQEEVVESFTMRTFCFGMISSPANVSSVSMVGVDPANERHLSQVDEALVEGTYFEGDDDRQLLIGRKLAELLEVGLGDRVVMTAAQAGTGDLAQEMFRVSGIYYFNVPQMDQYMAFVLISKARQMLALGDEVHQIALKFHDAYLGRDQDHPFWNRYSRNGNEAVGWTVLLPQLEAAFELSGFSTLIVAIILFGVVSLGIVNTLFMSLHERMFEFGVMRAVGTRPVAMGQLVILEAGALAILSVVLGMILGFVTLYISSRTGIDYTGIEFAGVTFRELLYPVMEVRQFIVFPLWIFAFTVGIAFYPAIYAARLTPAKAMRKSF